MNAASITKSKRQEIPISFISWRFTVLCSFILFVLLALMLRIIDLQVLNSDSLVRESDIRSLRVQRVPILRGMISDRSGSPLAVSVPVNAVWFDPKELNDRGGITSDIRWKALADVLSIPLNQLSSRIKNAHPKGRFIYLARQVNTTVGDYIHQLKLPGIYLRQELRRYYPAGPVTAHLIGITDRKSVV